MARTSAEAFLALASRDDSAEVERLVDAERAGPFSLGADGGEGVEADQILEFWLGPRTDEVPDAARVQRWFVSDPDLDRAIRTRFGDAVEAAIEGGLVEWEEPAHARVALVLLLDQFPRNLYRGDPRSFDGDARAMRLVRGTGQGELDSLHPIEHYFMLVPWMHSEDLADQVAGEAAFARAARERPSPFRSLFENGLAYATRHRVVIERFGRFPHRNEVLRRTTTEAERSFLSEREEGF